ncbi:Protein-tyrosine phosphatase [Teladorsagia circumcincta]|uniref:Protein-tyrosine phosphatase n=1 Tax=Teladorsagia circumcincta TaxID=45464 RepID=A0A2G9UC52_TELCI|nr:Protein-tyrosine phosphatase [Teladorsagia circumcincta]
MEFEHTLGAKNNVLVLVQKWVQRALDMGVDALRTEYRSLARYTLPEMTVDAFRANQEFGRNRYQDVPCQDQCRVVLKWHRAATDYIHANFVGTPVSPRRFILTQGPLEQTVNEFWHMVLQEEAETIIMLCNCIETGKYKCHPYWPDKTGEMKQFNGVEVYNVQTRVLSPEELTVMVCILNVKFAKPDGSMDAREVRHYQWMDWPDRGVPPLKLTSMPTLVPTPIPIRRKGWLALTYADILTEENKAKYKKFVEDYNQATGT